MPATVVTERWSDRSFTLSESATRGFDVAYAEDETSALLAVQSQMGVYLNAPHPKQPSQHVKTGGIVVTLIGQNFWLVKAQYAVGTFPDKQDPKQEPPTFAFQPESISDQVDTDIDGNLIVNAAGSLMTPLSRPRGRLTLVIAQNVASFPIDAFGQYENAYNSDQLRMGGKTIYPGQLCLRNISQITEAKLDADYVRIRYNITYDTGLYKDKGGVYDAFQARLVNKGMEAWWLYSDGTTNRGPIFAKSGPPPYKRISSPVPLDENGAVFDQQAYTGDDQGSSKPAQNSAPPNGATIIKPPNGFGTIIIYKNAKAAPFAALNLFY